MVLVIILLMVTTTALDIRRARAIFRGELEQRGLLLAGTLNEILADPLYFADVAQLQDIAQVVASQPDIAYVGVFSHPFFSVTSTDGQFTISGLNPGTYTITAWHERLGTQTASITVGADDTQSQDFEFVVLAAS